MFRSIRVRLLFTYIILAVLPLLLVGGYLVSQSFNNQQSQTLALQAQLSQRVAEQVASFIGKMETEMKLLTETQDLLSLDTEEQEAVLEQLWRYNESFQELTLTDRDGNELARSSRIGDDVDLVLGNRRNDIEFLQPLMQGDIYYSSVKFEENGEPLITLSIPILEPETNFGLGTLIAEVQFRDVWELIANVPVRKGENIYIVDSRNRVVAHRDSSVVLSEVAFKPPKENGRYPGLNGSDSFVTTSAVSLDFRAFDVVVERLAQDALAETLSSMFVTFLIIVISLATAVGVGFFVVNRITQPLDDLVKTAEIIQTGDFSHSAEEGGLREINALAIAFNGMTDQLRNLIDTLEQRVADRTQALETSTEVGRRLSTILERDELVKEVVEQIRAAFDYYHVHIYLMDAKEETLILAGGTGEVGQRMLAEGHRIALGRGLVGRAAVNNALVLVQDVSRDPGWLPNHLLPDTKAEAAVPIAIGSQVLGVLDVQHDVVDGLQEEDGRLLQSIANQVAVALRNALLYEDTQRQAERQILINEINQKIQATTDVESALQIAVREVGRAVGAQRSIVRLATTNGKKDREHPDEQANTLAESKA